jgi:hypothetical protein
LVSGLDGNCSPDPIEADTWFGSLWAIMILVTFQHTSWASENLYACLVIGKGPDGVRSIGSTSVRFFSSFFSLLFQKRKEEEKYQTENTACDIR